jgi:hypothetical protein
MLRTANRSRRASTFDDSVIEILFFILGSNGKTTAHILNQAGRIVQSNRTSMSVSVCGRCVALSSKFGAYDTSVDLSVPSAMSRSRAPVHTGLACLCGSEFKGCEVGTHSVLKTMLFCAASPRAPGGGARKKTFCAAPTALGDINTLTHGVAVG